ncbi:uncharacterized protein L203_105918 [Cryptococcus depauperatus CBS 7841]|uniref:Uncharacterized protein n=1 Tax=Cryptococcus depauperatus CBS 7841 TaxID=1295531 RepID=A0AAJ8M4J1_9TREE
MPPGYKAPSRPGDPLKGMKDSWDDETQDRSTTDGNHRNRAGTLIETLISKFSNYYLKFATGNPVNDFSKFEKITSALRNKLKTEGAETTYNQLGTILNDLDLTREKSTIHDKSKWRAGLTDCKGVATELKGVLAMMQMQQPSASRASRASDITPARYRSTAYSSTR